VNSYGADRVCQCVRVQLENRWTDMDEIWYELCVIGDQRKLLPFNIMEMVLKALSTHEFVRWEQH
jgi:hypothetical protein